MSSGVSSVHHPALDQDCDRQAGDGLRHREEAEDGLGPRRGRWVGLAGAALPQDAFAVGDHRDDERDVLALDGVDEQLVER